MIVRGTDRCGIDNKSKKWFVVCDIFVSSFDDDHWNLNIQNLRQLFVCHRTLSDWISLDVEASSNAEVKRNALDLVRQVRICRDPLISVIL